MALSLEEALGQTRPGGEDGTRDHPADGWEDAQWPEKIHTRKQAREVWRMGECSELGGRDKRLAEVARKFGITTGEAHVVLVAVRVERAVKRGEI